MAKPVVLADRALSRATLARQLLSAREKISVERAVERTLGLQAQWPKPPFVGLFSRIRDFERKDLARALLDFKVVRATFVRGTIHVTTRADFLAFRAGLDAPLMKLVETTLRGRMDHLDIAKVVRDARARFAKAPCTFTELRDYLVTKHPQANDRAMGLVARIGVPLIMTPTKTDAWSFPQDACFMLAENALGAAPKDHADAFARLAFRYLEAFGPATAADFGVWSSLRDTKTIFEKIRPKLTSFVDARGREIFDVPGGPRPDEGAKVPARFLPEFDNILLAYKDRSRFIQPKHKARVFLGGLRVAQTILVDGLAAGTWKSERKKKISGIIVSPFARLSSSARAELEIEGDALARFLEPDADTFEIDFMKPS